MTTAKLEGLNPGHWVFADYRQRMTTKEWKQALLNEQDTIIYRGNIVKLRVEKLGYGVVEVFKDISEDKEN